MPSRIGRAFFQRLKKTTDQSLEALLKYQGVPVENISRVVANKRKLVRHIEERLQQEGPAGVFLDE